jgi:hypothetical protein
MISTPHQGTKSSVFTPQKSSTIKYRATVWNKYYGSTPPDGHQPKINIQKENLDTEKVSNK